MYSFLVSILIGIGVVLPGVSGSAIAILVGIYDKVLTVLNDFSIKALKKIIILFPVIIGIMVGVVIFGNTLLKIYEYYEFQMKYIFVNEVLPSSYTKLNSYIIFMLMHSNELFFFVTFNSFWNALIIYFLILIIYF